MPGKGSCCNMQRIGRREHASTCSQCIAMCLRMVDISGHFVSKDECDVSYFGRMCSWVSALTSLITALPDTPLLVPNLFHMWRRLCGLMRFGTLFQDTVCHKVENYVFVIQQRRFKQIRKLWDHVDFSSHCCVKGENNFERSPGTWGFFWWNKTSRFCRLLTQRRLCATTYPVSFLYVQAINGMDIKIIFILYHELTIRFSSIP